MSTEIDMIAGSQLRDSQNETLDIKGCDISELEAGRGYFNDNHSNKLPDVLGHITFAKKIFGPEDCKDERQTYFWNKVKSPYIYVKGKLYDDDGDHRSAKATAAILRHQHKDDSPLKLKASVEGGIIERGEKDETLLKRTKLKGVALTFVPANNATLVEGLNLKKSLNPAADEALIKSLIPLARDNVPSFIEVADVLSETKIRSNIEKIKNLVKNLNKAIPPVRFGGEPISIDHLTEDEFLEHRKQYNKAFPKSTWDDYYRDYPVTMPAPDTPESPQPSSPQKQKNKKPKPGFRVNTDGNHIPETNGIPTDEHLKWHQNKNTNPSDFRGIIGPDGSLYTDDHHEIKTKLDEWAKGAMDFHGGMLAHLEPKMFKDVVGSRYMMSGFHPDVDKFLDHTALHGYVGVRSGSGAMIHGTNEALAENTPQNKTIQKLKQYKLIPENFNSNIVNADTLRTKLTKGLTAGFGGGSPTDKVGGQVLQTEQLDSGLKNKEIECPSCGKNNVYMKYQVRCRHCNKAYPFDTLSKFFTKE